MPHYDQTAIESIIPHRYENMLLDSCDCPEPSTAHFKTEIQPENDPLNRDIFAGRASKHPFYLLPELVPELLALAGICSMIDSFPNHKAFFAGISQFECDQILDLSNGIQGDVFPGSIKHSFYKYKGQVADRHGNKASAQITAFFNTEFLKADPLDPVKIDSEPLSSPKPYYKSSDMFLLDGIIETDKQSITTAYHYPVDHPISKGHFPESAIMMGVMQWMSVSDAFFAFASLNDLEPGRYTCKADVIRANDDKIAASLTGIEYDLQKDEQGLLVRVTKTKRIQFKEAVAAGHTLRIECRDIQEVSPSPLK